MEVPVFQCKDRPLAERVRDLLGKMTPEEKIAQLHQCGVGDANPNNISLKGDTLRPEYGSFILNGAEADLETRNALQKRCLTESRLGIPALFASDVIHGYRVITPIPLAQACSWNPELVRQGAAMAASMARAQGVDLTFAPMIDFCVDPRWGRIAESFGESPYALRLFCQASVLGYQGEKPGRPGTIAACLKHFVGYGASEGGRDYSATDISPQRLWEYHLPAFEAGVRAGARSVMSAFNDLNGVPASANTYTLSEVLRKRWGFDGPVISDWNAVLQLLNQGYSSSEEEAVLAAFKAGVDLDMADGLYLKYLPALLAAKRISIADLDQAVGRLLHLKFELGLFEQPYAEHCSLTGAPPSPSQLRLAEEMAAESMVLLKNDGVLPLQVMGRTIAVIGPLAAASAPLLGSWAQQGRAEETSSFLKAFREQLPADCTVNWSAGCELESGEDSARAEAVTLATQSAAVLLCLGEDWWMSGENASRSSLRLPLSQEKLAQALIETGKPVILLLVSGRPVELGPLHEGLAAILAAWQGGTCAASAAASLILGQRSPSGKLALTWPRTTGQIPLYHNMRPRARSGKEGAYQDIATTELYAFGHGLTYTHFLHGPLRLSSSELRPGQRLVAEVLVTNTGSRAGAETLFWFIHDCAASITRPLRELKHVEKAVLPEKASHLFRFEIDPARDLSFPDADGHQCLEAGDFELIVGEQRAKFILHTEI